MEDEGGYFLIHRFDGQVGSGKAACIEIIGYDAQGRNYSVQTFYNDGMRNDWRYHELDGTWTLTGDWTMGGKSMKTRCTVRFGDGGTTMKAKWECSGDGSQWQTFWDVKAIKA